MFFIFENQTHSTIQFRENIWVPAVVQDLQLAKIELVPRRIWGTKNTEGCQRFAFKEIIKKPNMLRYIPSIPMILLCFFSDE